MQIVINGQEHSSAGPLSLAQVVALLTSDRTGIAVAVNGEVVRRVAWATTLLADGDQVEVLTAVQGG
jgi:sulfur carrier protein